MPLFIDILMLFPTVQSTACENYAKEKRIKKNTQPEKPEDVSVWLGFLQADESSLKCPIKSFMQELHETTYFQMETRDGSITSITVPNHNEDPRLICCINIK